MPRIIKRGVNPVEYVYHYQCTNCQSVIEYSQSDVQFDQRDGDFVVCPVCRHGVAWEHVKERGDRHVPPATRTTPG